MSKKLNNLTSDNIYKKTVYNSGQALFHLRLRLFLSLIHQ